MAHGLPERHPSARGLRRVVLPVPRGDRPRRFGQLLVGLALYGFSMGLMIRAQLGVDPWDVFHLGLNHLLHIDLGLLIIAVSVVVLLAWIPMRQRPGIGTLANVLLIGLATSATLAWIPAPAPMLVRVSFLVAGVLLNGLAGALYIGAGLGPGARDGLMTGLVARGVGSVRTVRTCIEVTVLLVGWILSGTLWGGPVGPGTLLYALTIGPIVHWTLPRLTVRASSRPAPGSPRG
ncbi:hypothetical protein QDR37_06115 [Amnibacterium sp. CER49]|uniref:membrane protein YczE n=1 Tax=Amnibacterium sp. CER49 TaxID=3039161 RepID=UPI002449287F|nr:hypothetical protein [Amnibacterium sp. CER49]MDH2443515.1 hypothetical protein [Amnibacterium sp. CER49]